MLELHFLIMYKQYDSLHVLALEPSSAYRTQQLMNDVDELYRELLDTTSSFDSTASTLQTELGGLRNGPSDVELQRSLSRSRSAISDESLGKMKKVIISRSCIQHSMILFSKVSQAEMVVA